jgi:thiol-disulfide isomerase/thioredoxin
VIGNRGSRFARVVVVAAAIAIVHDASRACMVTDSRAASEQPATESSRAPGSSADGNPQWKGILDPIGPFEMSDLNGRRWSEHDFVGKILIVRLWSAHCGPCIADFPEVETFQKSLRGNSSVAFVSLNLDADSPALEKFFRDFRNEYSFPVLLGRSYFKVGPMPYTWIVDREGYIRDVYVGAPPDWRADTLVRADAVGRKPPVSSLSAAVREQRRLLNEKEGEKAVQLSK